MHGLSHLQHQVVCQVGQQVDAPAAAVKQADTHIHWAVLHRDVVHPQTGVAVGQLLILDVDGHGRKGVPPAAVRRVHGPEGATRQSGKFPGNTVMAPQVRPVGQGLVVHLEHSVLDSIQLLDIGAGDGILGQLHQSRMIGADAQLRFGAAHPFRGIARYRRFPNFAGAYTATRASKGDEHSLPDVWRAADTVHHAAARIHFEQMQLFGIRMLIH